MSTKKQRNPFVMSSDGLPDLDVVARIERAAVAVVPEVDTRKPGMAHIRDILPASLLIAGAARLAGDGDGALLRYDADGTEFIARPVDLQYAGLHLFAKAMAKMSAEMLPKLLEQPEFRARLYKPQEFSAPAPLASQGGGKRRRRQGRSKTTPKR